MITINSGNLSIPEEEFIIGFAGDNLHLKKQFKLENVSDPNCVHSLCLKFNEDTVNDIALDSKVENGSTILSWNISKEDILKFGLIKAQIKSVYKNGKTAHTSWDYFYVHPSNEFSEKFENIDISDFFDYKAKITELYDKMGNTDFSTFVSSNRNIAGINLADDIEASALCDALKVCPTIIKAGAPTVFDGAVGKYLIDTLNNDLYYCKERTLSGNNWIKLSSSVDNVNIIKNAQINENGELVLTFNDDSTSTVGVVVGKNGKDGEDGYDGIDGMDGEDGKDGYTPKKGVDYFTEEDKAEMVTQAKAGLSQIAPPTVVNSVDEMTNTTKHYVLNGYIYAYMSNNGGLKPDFTNLAAPSSESWKNGYRINSSNQYVEASGFLTTNWFSCKTGSVIRVKGLAIARVGLSTGGTESGGYSGFNLSNDGTTPILAVKMSEEKAYPLISRDTDGIETLDLTNYSTSAGEFNYVCLTGRIENTEEDIIITVDEEIKYSQATGYEWTNTGLQYTATLYTDLIGIVDENNVIRLSSNNLPSGTYTLKYGDENFDTIGTITID